MTSCLWAVRGVSLAALPARLAELAGLAGSGDRRLWMTFQIRLTAALREVNFLTGVTPARLFQISIERAAGHETASLPRSSWELKYSASSMREALASLIEAKAVMLFSGSMVKVVIATPFTPLGPRSQSNLHWFRPFQRVQPSVGH